MEIIRLKPNDSDLISMAYSAFYASAKSCYVIIALLSDEKPPFLNFFN